MTSTPTPVLSEDEQYRIVYQAISGIAAQCDGAVSKDFVGFDGSDTLFGRRIAQMDYDAWTPEIKAEAARILGRKYHHQAREITGLVVDTLEVVSREVANEAHHVARQQARENQRRQAALGERKVTLSNSMVQIRWNRRDADFKLFYEAVKGAGAQWDGSAWNLASNRVDKALLNVLACSNFDISDEAEAVFEAAPERQPMGSVELVNDRIKVTLKKKLGGLAFAQYRTLEGYRWERGTDTSLVDITTKNLEWLESNDFSGITEVRETAGKIAASRQAQREAAEARGKLLSYLSRLSDPTQIPAEAVGVVLPDGLPLISPAPHMAAVVRQEPVRIRLVGNRTQVKRVEGNAKQAYCRDCGNVFDLPATRGRPPIRCERCRAK